MSHSHFDYDGPRKSNPGPNEVGIIVYGYLPSLALPVVAIITFALTLAAQVYFSIKKPKMYRTFHILMAMGSVSPLPLPSLPYTLQHVPPSYPAFAVIELHTPQSMY